MKTEEFDKLIRSKIAADDSEQLWDKAKVWNKVVAGQRKKRFAIFRYAAVFVLFAITGLSYLLIIPKKDDSSKNEIKNSKPLIGIQPQKVVQKRVIEGEILAKKKPKRKEKKHEKPTEVLAEVNKKEVEENIDKLQKPLKIEQGKEDSLLVEVNEAVAVEKVRDTVSTQSVPETNYVVTLVIPDKMEYKEYKDRKLVGRFFQQVKRYSNGEKFDWGKVYKKPPKLWAYLKNSFVPDSSVVH